MRYSIGIDLGGTKLAAALVSESGQIIQYIKIPVNMRSAGSATQAQRQIVQMITNMILDLKKRFPKECHLKKFVGVGLASAGPMNVEKGMLVYPANFPGWKSYPILKRVQDSLHQAGFKAPLYFQNDAIAAAYAEKWQGGARQMESFALVTIGTGIGTGVIVNNHPCQTHGMGSEFGHMLVDISSLRKKIKLQSHYTVEGIASGTGLLRRAQELGFKGESVEELIAMGGQKYKALFTDMSWALAVLCYNLSIGFHLDGIFLSGGLIKIQTLFFDSLVIHYRNLIRSFNKSFECPLKIAKTRNQAGVLGAAYLPFRRD